MGAARLRSAYATPAITRLREAVGLRDLSQVVAGSDAGKPKRSSDAGVPSFKQYRDADGSSTSSWCKASACCCSAGFDSRVMPGSGLHRSKAARWMPMWPISCWAKACAVMKSTLRWRRLWRRRWRSRGSKSALSRLRERGSCGGRFTAATPDHPAAPSGSAPLRRRCRRGGRRSG